jgi:hypothetical protein
VDKSITFALVDVQKTNLTATVHMQERSSNHKASVLINRAMRICVVASTQQTFHIAMAPTNSLVMSKLVKKGLV